MEWPAYMYQLKGFKCRGKLIQLHLQLYGLKSAAKAWHNTLVAKIKEFRFTIVTNDDCMFTIKLGNSVLHILIIVDDILQATNDEKLRQEFLVFLRTDY
eukprot:221262-Rhodomonas_salina.1